MITAVAIAIIYIGLVALVQTDREADRVLVISHMGS